MIKKSLTVQLIWVCVSILSVMIISLGLILPNNLVPIYEANVYNYLRQPLSFLQTADDINDNKITTEVAYIYISANNVISVSDNIGVVVDIRDIDKLLSKLDFKHDNGKFNYGRGTYYYVVSNSNSIVRIAITNDSYISNMKKDIYLIIFRVVGATFVIVALFILAWSNNLLNRIKRLKDKIDNINNDEYDHNPDNRYIDELYILDRAVADMHDYLKEQEDYKNQMYQNISHDFKTPITVMESYIEAYNDGIQTSDETFNVIKEQLKKLEIKVHSLLYLNKLNYFKDKKDVLNEKFDVSIVINASVEKFKMSRPDLKFILNIDKKNVMFRGSREMWEAIIDNILNNFMRYAKGEVSVTVKNNKIILFNDGENISDNVLNNIFTPYEKGINGIFGLGLSIVKKTLLFLNYDITIENTKNGVKFTIY